MEGIQIVELVIFLVSVAALDLLAMRRGFDSRFSSHSKYEHPR
ncbi:MAG: hypothetical protein QOH93_1669, partial [Chloroflexia bacterium]|nr:hypothetical protein [Chloroflexia bacterium]